MPGEKYSSYQIGGSAWKQLVMNRARRLSTRISKFIDNEFETDTASSEFIYATGAITYDIPLSGGIARVRTTTVGAPGGAAVYNAGGAAIVGSPAGESWFASANCNIQDTPSATTEFRCVGLTNTLAPGADFVTFGLLGTIDTVYLSLWISLGGAAGTQAITSIPGGIGSFAEYGMGYDVEDDRFIAMVDDSIVIDMTGPFADLSSNSCFMFSGANNGLAGTQDTEIWVDNLACVVEPA